MKMKQLNANMQRQVTIVLRPFLDFMYFFNPPKAHNMVVLMLDPWFKDLSVMVDYVGHSCRNPSLGLATKVRGCKVMGQKKNPGVTSRAPGSAKECGNEPSYSQMNSHVGSWSFKWTPKSSRRDCRGQNSSPWKVLYIIGKLLKCRCLKWACIAHLDIWKTSYGQKKGWESTHFLACRQCATYRWKALNDGYNFALDFLIIGSLHAKLCASKVVRVLIMGILEFPNGSLGIKSHLDVAPVERCRVYYKGEGGGFPQV